MKISRDGNGGAGITSVTAAIPATSTTVTFNQPSTQIIITNYSLSSGNNTSLYVSFSGAATSSNYTLAASSNGSSILKYDGPAVSSIQILGSQGLDNYGILAW